MTLAPLVDPSVHGVEGRPIVVEERCAAPNCTETAQERHHLWPRSFLRGQPVEWVSVQEQVIPNAVGLCRPHHREVTGTRGHLAHIRWNTKLKLMEWWVNESTRQNEPNWVSRGPLRYQPLHQLQPAPSRGTREVCVGCGRPTPSPRPSMPPGERRRVKTWSIAVPDDTEEGAEVLDTYIEDIGMLMGYHDIKPRLLRYHVLVPVLEWVNQNRVEFLHDWEEAS